MGPCSKAHPASALAMLSWRHIEVHVMGVAHDGTQSSVAHVVYRYEDDSTFWEYEPMLRCFLEDRARVEMWKEAKKERCALEKLTDKLSLQFDGLYQPSVRMCQRDSSLAPNAYTRSAQTLATSLVVVQHVLWAVAAWKNRQKARAHSMGKALFERCLSDQTFSLGAATQVYESGVGFCSEVLGDECPHLSLAALRDIVAGAGAPQAAAWACLVALLPKVDKCGLAKHIFKWMVVVASQAIDRSFESKSMDVAPQKIELKSVGGSGRKRAPDSYKRFVMTMVRASNRGINGKAAMKLDGYSASRHHAWMLKEVCMYQAACSRCFVQKGVFGVWEDAARLGKPAREVLLMIGFSSGDQQGCVMPPQVLGAPIDLCVRAHRTRSPSFFWGEILYMINVALQTASGGRQDPHGWCAITVPPQSFSTGRLNVLKAVSIKSVGAVRTRTPRQIRLSRASAGVEATRSVATHHRIGPSTRSGPR